MSITFWSMLVGVRVPKAVQVEERTMERAAGSRFLALVVRLVPAGLLDLAMRHGFSRPMMAVRRLLGRNMTSAIDGIPIPRGPLRGTLFAFDPADGKATWMGVHEPKVQEALVGELRPGQVAFDIGAHLGYMVLLMARCVGPDGRVIGFEPDPSNMRFLLKNLELNSVHWAEGSALAVGEAQGMGEIKKGWGSGYSQVAVGEGDIKVATLDDEVFSGRLPRPNLILIDTEGAELSILKGGRRVLSELSPTVIVEVHGPDPGHPDIESGQREKLIAFMAELGFRYEEPDDSHLLFRI